LIGFTALAIWQLGRLGFQLARSEQYAQKLEYQDLLTGLPNHSRFFELFDEAISKRGPEELLGFAVLDLDGFDEVNDALGYAGGDEVLVEVGERLRQGLPPGTLAARRRCASRSFAQSGSISSFTLLSALVLPLLHTMAVSATR